MKVEVLVFATLRKDRPPRTVVELPEGARLQDALAAVTIPLAEIALPFINGRHAPGNPVLHDQDVIALFPAIAGG